GSLVRQVRRAFSAHRHDRAVHSPDDIRHRDRGRGPSQPVAAAPAAPAVDDSGTPEVAQDAFQELVRNILYGGDFLCLHRAVTLSYGQLQYRPYRVIRPRRDPHASIVGRISMDNGRTAPP